MRPSQRSNEGLDLDAGGLGPPPEPEWRMRAMSRFIDPTYTPEVRRALGLVTVARTTANSGYRFAPPFLAAIASDLDVSLSTLGLVLAISELAGLAGGRLGHLADRLDRRRTMVGALASVAAAAGVAGAAPHPIVLALALWWLVWSKILFDVTLVGWLSDRIPYARRAGAVGLTETSWALSMLVGVPIMGLVTAMASWRWGFATAAVGILVLAVLIATRLGPDHHRAERMASQEGSSERSRLDTAAWILVAGIAALMAASQAVTVTFGSWLEDRHGFSEIAIAAVVVGLGLIELVSSLSVARFTDSMGKARSVLAGVLVMIPGAALLAIGSSHPVVGIAALLAVIGGFEFAVVASISLSTELVPGRPAAGLGTMIGMGTLGRALASVAATWLYEQGGMWVPSVMAGVLGLMTVAGVRISQRLRPEGATADIHS